MDEFLVIPKALEPKSIPKGLINQVLHFTPMNRMVSSPYRNSVILWVFCFLLFQILKNDQSMNSGEEGDKDKIMLDKDNHQEASPKKSCCR